MIAFPPCTDLAVSGSAWFEEKRKDGRQQKAIEFFMSIVESPSKKTKSGVTTYSGPAYKWFRTKEERSRERSKTYPGIAQAMATQWGEYLKTKII